MPPADIVTARPDIEQRPRTINEILPPYQVILHNDDVHAMDFVIRALLRSIPSMGLVKATKIMLEAHQLGQARVTVCPKELAELFRERLQSYGLIATIEPA